MAIVKILIFSIVLGVLSWGSQVLLLRLFTHLLIKEEKGWGAPIRTILWLNVIMAILTKLLSLQTLDNRLLSIFIALPLLHLSYKTSWERKTLISLLLAISSLITNIGFMFFITWLLKFIP